MGDLALELKSPQPTMLPWLSRVVGGWWAQELDHPNDGSSTWNLVESGYITTILHCNAQTTQIRIHFVHGLFCVARHPFHLTHFGMLSRHWPAFGEIFEFLGHFGRILKVSPSSTIKGPGLPHSTKPGSAMTPT